MQKKTASLQVTLIVSGAIFFWLALIRILRKLHRVPAPPFIGQFLDSQLGRRRQPPGKVIERSGMKRGMAVMDLGSGSGAFTTYVARVVEHVHFGCEKVCSCCQKGASCYGL